MTGEKDAQTERAKNHLFSLDEGRRRTRSASLCQIMIKNDDPDDEDDVLETKYFA